MTSPETLELEAVDAALAGRYVAPEHAELAELALLLRDDRPEPTLELGDAHGPPRRGRLSRPAAAAIAAAAGRVVEADRGRGAPDRSRSSLAVALFGSADGTDDSGAGSSEHRRVLGQRRRRPAESQAPPDDRPTRRRRASAVTAPAASRPASGAKSDARPNRKVQRSASLTLATPRRDIDKVASQVGDVTADARRLRRRVERQQLGRRRPPAARPVQPARHRDPADLASSPVCATSRAGRSTSPPRSCRRATGSRDARTERESLLRQLAAADTVNETESIRARLDIVSQEIAAARTSLRRVNNRANFANVSVALVPRSRREPDGRRRLDSRRRVRRRAARARGRRRRRGDRGAPCSCRC